MVGKEGEGNQGRTVRLNKCLRVVTPPPVGKEQLDLERWVEVTFHTAVFHFPNINEMN